VKRLSFLLAPFAALAFAVAGAAAAPSPSTVYNAVPRPLPPNMASLGFQATQTAELGDYVHLAGANRVADTVTVTMSDWALRSDYPALPSAGWTHPITLNIYKAVSGTPLNTVGPLLGTVTQTVRIPWRPAADATCPGGTAWRAGDGQCYNGFAFNASFNLRGLNLVLPSDVIVTVAYNTQSYGAAPIGAPGPYNSLNVGLEGSATVGSDDDADRVFWNTSTAAWYTDGGAAGVGILREDTNWAPYGTLPIQITASARRPGSRDNCKNGGWKGFDSPGFRNQGDCVSYVDDHNNHGDRDDHDRH
jgi:hypothetical protein